MRIAVIADTHGNLTALEAVLNEIRSNDVENIVCLGDVSGLGPHPKETLQRVRSLECPVVMGNADEFLLDPSLLDPARHPDADENLRRMLDIERWCASFLDDDDRAFIRTFQPLVRMPLDDGETLLCYHGSPRSAWEGILPTTPDSQVLDMLGEAQPLVAAGGHTHEPMVRRVGHTMVINGGSVGLAYEAMPDGVASNPPRAEYAVITHERGTLRVELRRVPLDPAIHREAVLQSGMPHAAWWGAFRA